MYVLISYRGAGLMFSCGMRSTEKVSPDPEESTSLSWDNKDKTPDARVGLREFE